MSKNVMDHVVLTDDDGSGTTGTILNNALFDQVQDEVDEAIGQVVRTETGTYSVAVTDDTIICTATLTLNLYAASGNSGRRIRVANASNTAVVTIDGNSIETIDGVTTYRLLPWESVIIVCNGTEWNTEANRAEIEWTETATITTGTLAIDLRNAKRTPAVFNVSLNANIGTFLITGAPPAPILAQFSIRFTGDGTLRTITWGASVRFPSGIGPTMTSTNGKVDWITFLSVDGGTTWDAMIMGQNF
jgi:hypothetical protein